MKSACSSDTRLGVLPICRYKFEVASFVEEDGLIVLLGALGLPPLAKLAKLAQYSVSSAEPANLAEPSVPSADPTDFAEPSGQYAIMVFNPLGIANTCALDTIRGALAGEAWDNMMDNFNLQRGDTMVLHAFGNESLTQLYFKYYSPWPMTLRELEVNFQPRCPDFTTSSDGGTLETMKGTTSSAKSTLETAKGKHTLKERQRTQSAPKKMEAAKGEVYALLVGGGYAKKVSVPEGHVLPIPRGGTLVDATGLPEVTCTVWPTVFMMSKLTSGGTFLVHEGSSRIGTFAIQIAKAKGVKVITTVGSAEKAKFVVGLGEDVVINYKEEDFVAKVKQAMHGKGVDVILDNIGASYFQKNINTLIVGGRLFFIGFMGGALGQFNLAPLLAKGLTVQGAGLQSRSKENNAEIVAEVLKNVWPKVESGSVKSVLNGSFPLAEALKAHALLESSKHIGKILLTT